MAAPLACIPRFAVLPCVELGQVEHQRFGRIAPIPAARLSARALGTFEGRLPRAAAMTRVLQRLDGYRRRALHEWSMWRHRTERKRSHRKFRAWLHQLRNDPPDVLVGANFASFGGVRNHIQAIQRYSALRVGLAPPERLIATVPTHYFTHVFSQEFQEFPAAGIRAAHSHVFPWFIHWCRQHKRADLRWIHTYHLPYFPEHGRDGLEPWQKEINDSLLGDARHADVRISVSRWQQQYLLEHCGIDAIYIPNGVDVALCDKGNANRFKQKTGIDRFVLYVGRNDPVKNPTDFVRLAEKLPEEKFVMIGHSLASETLEREWEVVIPSNLHVYGSASHAEVQDAIAASSVVVVTSKREGLPTLVLEALAHRKTVVVPDESGCMEAVDGGRFGLVYKQHDIDDLAEKTQTALGDPERFCGAREHVLAQYDWRVVAPKLDRLYAGETS